MSEAFATAFKRDAHLFPFQLDIANDRVLIAQLDAADYHSASFLDQRLLQEQPPLEWVPWAMLEALSQEMRSDAQFIFHIGHVGSTLISRLLGEYDAFFALREPQLLRSFAELKLISGKAESPWHPELLAPRLATATRWLSRTFAPEERALIKATSFVSEIAADVVGNERRALFLYVSPERYIQTILAGENSRQELTMLSGSRLNRLHDAIGTRRWNLWEMPEAVRAAMSWACEITALERAAAALPDSSILWFDFDSFLTDPSASLASVAAFFGADNHSGLASKLINGPIMQHYSKAPEHGYSPQLRDQLLAQTSSQRSSDIAAALRWLDDAAGEFALIAEALDRQRRP